MNMRNIAMIHTTNWSGRTQLRGQYNPNTDYGQGKNPVRDIREIMERPDLTKELMITYMDGTQARMTF